MEKDRKMNETTKQSVGKIEPELRFGPGTVLFFVIGLIASWINMSFISVSMEVSAYLTVIFTVMVFGCIIAYLNRYWGYGYMCGFTIAGIPYALWVDLFVGGYTFFTSLFIFVILWLVFWKAWRSISSIKSIKEE